MVINLWGLDKYESKHTGSQKTHTSKHQTNVQVNKNGRTDMKDISNYTFEWRDLWCHGTSAINDIGH